MQIEVLPPSAESSAQILRRLSARLPLRALRRLEDASPEAVLWVHGDAGLPTSAGEVLRERVARGGLLLLTGTAAAWIAGSGIEPVRPEIRRRCHPRDVGTRELRGVMALPGQPLFHRFPGGVYLRSATPDGPDVEAVWDRDRWPRASRVLGVEKLPIGCDASRAILVEARHGRGRVLALGAHLPLDCPDPEFDENRARFLGDLFDYLVADLAGGRGPSWPDPRAPRHARIVGNEPSIEVERTAARVRSDGLERSVEPAEDRSFVLVASDGVTAYGRTRGFIDEIWARGFRAMRDLRLGVARAGGAPSPFESSLVEVRVHPDDVAWTWRDDFGTLAVRIACGSVGLTVHFEVDGPPLEVTLSGRCDLRAFWPYPAGLSPTMSASSGDDGRVLVFRDELLGFESFLAADRAPLRAVSRDVSAPVVDGDGGAMIGFERAFDLRSEAKLTLGLGVRPTAVARDTGSAAGTLLVRVGVESLDSALELVRARMSDFVLPMPDGPRALVAGHDRARRGWFTGRPGYAWFFARDAFFCDHALLLCGARDAVREDLRLAARFQDPLGKIHHEITPLSVVHHDAADSTPMFVDLLGRWLAITGDVELVRELWPAVKRAIAWMQATDRDGDGLPENRGVGHGWMEGGTLAEHVEIEVYLAAFACRAFAAARFLAAEVGDSEVERRARQAAERARASLRARFFRGEDGGFAHAILVGGARDDRDAATTVVPWTLALGEPGRENDALRRFASARARADWGTRMLPSDDPAYQPDSYQAGSVWPLFTGWTLLADFVHGRPDSAWLALGTLTRSVEQFAPGCVQEVFRGDVFAPRGITAMQAWSHSAVLGGFTEGLLGVRTVLGEARVILEPTLPGALDELHFEGLALGASQLSGSIVRGRDGGGLTVEIRCEGAPTELDVAPFVTRPFELRGATKDGVPIDVHIEELGDGALLRVALDLKPGATEVRFDVVPDLVIALDADACRPGAPSSAPRFLGRRVLGEDCVALDFELNRSARVALRAPGRAIASVEGADLDAEVSALSIVPADGAPTSVDGYRPCTVTVRFAPRN